MYTVNKIFLVNLLILPVMLSFGQTIDKDIYESDFKHRSALLIDHVANYYPGSKPGFPPGADAVLDDFGKYNYPLFIAIFSRNSSGSISEQMIAERMRKYAGRPTFHFNLVGLTRLLYLFPNQAAIKENQMALLQRVWERKDSYNTWTAEGTENHISMSKTSAYLYAQFAGDQYPDVFKDAGAKMKMMKEWIMDWSKKIFTTGTGEFNSGIYQAYNIIGWLNLYDFAKDTEVKKAARAVLDYYAAEMSLHYVQGMSGGSDMRGQNCIRSFAGSYAYLAWLWFGDSPAMLSAQNLGGPNNNNELIQSVHAATSAYRPPLLAVSLATQKFTYAAMYYGSKPAYSLNKQGFVKQSLYADKNYLLGAGYFPYGGWGSGNNQIVSWKLISRVDSGNNKSAQFVSGIGIQSPKDKRFGGGNKRSPYDQLVHHKNVLIQLTKLPVNAAEQQQQMQAIYEKWRSSWAADFAKRFPTDTFKLHHNPIKLQEMDMSVNQSFLCFSNSGKINTIFDKQVLFVEMEKTFVAIRSVRGDAPSALQLSDGGETKFTSVSSVAGKLVGFILEVANSSDYQNFEKFRVAILQKTILKNELIDSQNKISYLSTKGDLIEVQYQSNGTFTEPIFDFGYGVKEPMLIISEPPLQQPQWPVGEGHGRIASWSVNGQPVNLQKYWPVYTGPLLYVGKGKLILKDKSKHTYTIDYTSKIPLFDK